MDTDYMVWVTKDFYFGEKNVHISKRSSHNKQKILTKRKIFLPKATNSHNTQIIPRTGNKLSQQEQFLTHQGKTFTAVKKFPSSKKILTIVIKFSQQEKNSHGSKKVLTAVKKFSQL